MTEADPAPRSPRGRAARLGVLALGLCALAAALLREPLLTAGVRLLLGERVPSGAAVTVRAVRGWPPRVELAALSAPLPGGLQVRADAADLTLTRRGGRWLPEELRVRRIQVVGTAPSSPPALVGGALTARRRDGTYEVRASGRVRVLGPATFEGVLDPNDPAWRRGARLRGSVSAPGMRIPTLTWSAHGTLDAGLTRMEVSAPRVDLPTEAGVPIEDLRAVFGAPPPSSAPRRVAVTASVAEGVVRARGPTTGPLRVAGEDLHLAAAPAPLEEVRASGEVDVSGRLAVLALERARARLGVHAPDVAVATEGYGLDAPLSLGDVRGHGTASLAPDGASSAALSLSGLVLGGSFEAEAALPARGAPSSVRVTLTHLDPGAVSAQLGIRSLPGDGPVDVLASWERGGGPEGIQLRLRRDTLAVRVSTAGPAAPARLEVDQLPLQELLEWLDLPPLARGHVDGRGGLRAAPDGAVRATVEVTAGAGTALLNPRTEAFLGDLRGTVRGRLGPGGSRWELAPLRARSLGGSLTLTGTVHRPHRARDRLHLAASGLRAGELVDLLVRRGLRLDGSLDAALDLALGEAAEDWTAEGTLAAPSLEAAALGYEERVRVALVGLRGPLSIGPRRTAVGPLRARVAGGRATLSMRSSAEATGVPWTGHLELEGVDLPALFRGALDPEDAVEGTVDLALDVAGRGLDVARVRGRGALSASGRIGQLRFLDEWGRPRGLRAVRDLEITSATARIVLRPGEAVLEEIRVRANKGNLAGRVAVDPRTGALDGRLHVRLSRRLFPGGTRIRAAIAGVPTVVLDVRFGGTLAEPTAEVDAPTLTGDVARNLGLMLSPAQGPYLALKGIRLLFRGLGKLFGR